MQSYGLHPACSYLSVLLMYSRTAIVQHSACLTTDLPSKHILF
uniref:Uncharacterized protein n=1 Tax=Arundo donax TaxID=35708 RepID=A0A0A9FG12_ARUDO